MPTPFHDQPTWLERACDRVERYYLGQLLMFAIASMGVCVLIYLLNTP